MILLKVESGDAARGSRGSRGRRGRRGRSGSAGDVSRSSSSAPSPTSKPASSAACSRRTASWRCCRPRWRTAVFPLNVNELGEVRISVRPEDADEARRIIDSHRTELETGKVVRLRDEFETLQQAIDYRFRDRGLLEHAMTHTSRANEDVSGGVIDNESLEFLGDAVLGFVVADILFHAFPEFNEGQKSKVKAALVSTADAGAAGGAAGARRSPAARPRRGEDRRPPQAGAARRRLRGADRGDLPGRRRRAGARLHHARVRAADRRGPAQPASLGGDHKSALQEYLQSQRRAAARIPPRRHASAPTTASCSRSRSWSATRSLARGDRAEQEGSGAGGGKARAGEGCEREPVGIYNCKFYNRKFSRSR